MEKKWYQFWKQRTVSDDYISALDVDDDEDDSRQKASRGSIEESDFYGVRDGYVRRQIQRRGMDYGDMWAAYLTDPWIRACVDKITSEVMRYELVVKLEEGIEDDDENALKHKEEVETLFENPNERNESFETLRRKYIKDLLIYDAAAIEIVYRAGGKKELADKVILLTRMKRKYQGRMLDTGELDRQIEELNKRIAKIDGVTKKRANTPVELYDLSGPKIKFNVDKHGNFKNEGKEAYKLVNAQHKVIETFGKDEVIYLMRFPRAGAIYGLSPIETLIDAIENDINASSFNGKILKHHGMLSGVLSFPGMSSKKLKKNQRYWQEEIRRKGQKLIVTNNKDVTYTKLSENQRDMQFLEYQQWILSKIMAVYGMQPLVLGIITPNTGKLNSKEQRKQFREEVIYPLLKLEAYHLTDILVRKGFQYEDIRVSFAEPEDVDEEFNLEKLTVMGKLGIVTINEARELMGYEPLEEGGDVLVSQNLISAINQELEAEKFAKEKKGRIQEIRERIQELLDQGEEEEIPKENLETEEEPIE